MFNLQNKIIVVDDNEEHLIRLGKEFLDCGLGCRTLKYDAMYDTKLSSVRLAFFDINLLGKNLNLAQDEYDYTQDKSLSAVFNDLSNAIKSYISLDNGPFALIFWSSNTALINNFIKYVNERNLHLPKPILISGINKDEFLQSEKDGSDRTIKDLIVEIISNSPTNLLFEFEDKAQEAVRKTINEIFKLIPDGEGWGENNAFDQNFELIFSKIATCAVGYEQAIENPDKAVMEALTPAIHYDLMNIETKNWKNFLTSISNRDLAFPENFSVGKLNAIFHVDAKSNVDFSKRGAVFIYNFEHKPSQVSNPFNYFSELELQSKEAFNTFVKFKKKETSEIERDKIRSDSKFIVTEISAVCDFSQGSTRNLKFILGLLTPIIDFKKIDKTSDSIFFRDIPIIEIEGECFQLWLNFNFSISDFNISRNIGRPLFILKKEIMDMIGNRYANHVSRIGITRF